MDSRLSHIRAEDEERYTVRMQKWLPYVPMTLFATAVLVGIILLWEHMATILTLLLVTAIIAYLITPLSVIFERWMNRSLATLSSFALIVLALGGVIWITIPALYRQIMHIAQQMPEYTAQIEQAWSSALSALEQSGISVEIIRQIDDQIFSTSESLLLWVQEALLNMGGSVVNHSWLALAPVTAFYFVRDRAVIFDHLLHLIPTAIRPASLKWASKVRDVLGSYVRGQLLVSLIVGALTALGLMLAGIEGYLVLGFLMALLNLVPIFGPILCMVPIIALAAVQGKVIPAVLLSIAIQQVESAAISPRIMSGVTGVHPVIIIIVLLLGGSIGGAGGMVLALPTYLILRVTAKELYLSAMNAAQHPPDAIELDTEEKS